MAVSCQKENSPEPENYTEFESGVINLPVSVENNTLVFETEEDYQKCLDYLGNANTKQLNDFEKVLNFTSLRSSDKSKTLKNEDELFLTLLNTQRSIIIANHIFTVDFEKERTFMTPLGESSNLKSSETLDFGWDENVFEYLETGNRSVLKGYCTNDREKFKEWEFEKGNMYGYLKLKAKVCFQRYGIYNTIIIKLKLVDKGKYAPLVNVRFDTYGNDKFNYWKNRKDIGHIYYKNVHSILSGSGNNISRRPYNRTRRLKHYRVWVTFKYWGEFNGHFGDQILLKIEC